MAGLITQMDIDYIKSCYPLVKLPEISPQLEQGVMYYMRGMALPAAARAAGMMTTASLRKLVESEGGKALLEYLRDREFSDVRITRDTITGMFLSAYHKSATATEMVMATRELAKLHGLYPESKPAINVNVNAHAGSHVEVNAKKIERMSDADLIKLAPDLLNALTPPEPIEAEFEEMPNDPEPAK